MKKVKCCKCGSEDILTRFQERLDHELDYPCESKNYAEHLHRHCRNCQYFWCDMPLDMKDVK